jgi:hypothetical protein
MHDRMQYLRLMYTCLQEVNDVGGTCLDPIQWLYDVPADKTWSKDVAKTFMLARTLKVSPVLNKTVDKSNTFSSYFPKGRWVNMADWSEIITGKDDLALLSIRKTVNVHLAPGALIPFQDNSDFKIFTTADALKKPIMIVANRDEHASAKGTLLLDQGVSQREIDDGKFEYYNIYVQANSVQFKGDASYGGPDAQPHTLDKIALVNAEDLANVDFACYYTPDSLIPIGMTPRYDGNLKTLFITPAQATRFSDIENVYYGSTSRGDLNLCEEKGKFDYKIVKSNNPNPGLPTNVTGLKEVTYELAYMGSAKLSNIQLTVGFFDSGILNIKWTWAVA